MENKEEFKKKKTHPITIENEHELHKDTDVAMHFPFVKDFTQGKIK